MAEREDVVAPALGHGSGHRQLEVAADEDAGHRAARHQLGGEVRARPRGRDRPERALEHAARRVAEARRRPLQPGRGAGDEAGGEAAQSFVEEARRKRAGDQLLDGRHHAGARRSCIGGWAGSLVRSRIGPIGVTPAIASLANDHEKETAPAS